MMLPMVSILLAYRAVWEAVHVLGTTNEVFDLLSRGRVPEQLWAGVALRIPNPLRLENLLFYLITC